MLHSLNRNVIEFQPVFIVVPVLVYLFASILVIGQAMMWAKYVPTMAPGTNSHAAFHEKIEPWIPGYLFQQLGGREHITNTDKGRPLRRREGLVHSQKFKDLRFLAKVPGNYLCRAGYKMVGRSIGGRISAEN